ncbi:hypothetical protein HNP76_002028 [Treponema ruminis]|uniref:Uncharacterized protein n=1 Tax=Treponema ruminis TaxID=744515 RepID=A0A7W8GA78_9SPIR|nr:hypothetical protein [Treponema ruminis]
MSETLQYYRGDSLQVLHVKLSRDLTCGVGECKFCGSRGIMDCKELKIGKSKKELLAVFKDMGYEIKL